VCFGYTLYPSLPCPFSIQYRQGRSNPRLLHKLARRLSCPHRSQLDNFRLLHIHPRREAGRTIHPLLLLPCPNALQAYTGYTLCPVLPVSPSSSACPPRPPHPPPPRNSAHRPPPSLFRNKQKAQGIKEQRGHTEHLAYIVYPAYSVLPPQGATY